tara:strand:+ start:5089 stop:5259 length:171 start_codon:yes stop_codon:yes gene_type:complete
MVTPVGVTVPHVVYGKDPSTSYDTHTKKLIILEFVSDAEALPLSQSNFLVSIGDLL